MNSATAAFGSATRRIEDVEQRRDVPRKMSGDPGEARHVLEQSAEVAGHTASERRQRSNEVRSEAGAARWPIGNSRRICRAAVLAVFALAAVGTIGCSALPLPATLSGAAKVGPWKLADPKTPRATAKNPAVRCVCLWQPAQGPGLDNRTGRGFAGQVFFFTRDETRPVVAEGDVSIFVFDDQGSAEEQARPLHTFEFRNNAFQGFLVSTQFGPAYELFVPYTRRGLHEAECALRVRLDQPNGPVVLSELVHVQLPGLPKGTGSSPSARSADASDDRVGPANDAREDTPNRFPPGPPGESPIASPIKTPRLTGNSAKFGRNALTDALGRRRSGAADRNASGGSGFQHADGDPSSLAAATAETVVRSGQSDVQPMIRQFLEQTLQAEAHRRAAGQTDRTDRTDRSASNAPSIAVAVSASASAAPSAGNAVPDQQPQSAASSPPRKRFQLQPAGS